MGASNFFAILVDQFKQYFNDAILIAILIEQNMHLLAILTDAGNNLAIQYLWKSEAIYYQSLTSGGIRAHRKARLARLAR